MPTYPHKSIWSYLMPTFLRALWEHKKREEEEQQMRELQEAREYSMNRIFGRLDQTKQLLYALAK